VLSARDIRVAESVVEGGARREDDHSSRADVWRLACKGDAVIDSFDSSTHLSPFIAYVATSFLD
jgi:hypothetical protein